ncbi:MAG: winged helix-turn-helix domain-containing protein [Candidatus Acidiferrales bacterium]
MASPAQPSLVFRFGQFELDAASGELRKAGVSLKLHPQPFRVLLLLAERPKQIVSRDEIQRRLWGDHTFVDFERGINSCVNQIRATLGDDPEKPRYIETLPRRGYRFIASVTTEHRAEPAVTSVSPTVVPFPRPNSGELGPDAPHGGDLYVVAREAPLPLLKRKRMLVITIAALGALVLAGFGAYRRLSPGTRPNFQDTQVIRLTDSGKAEDEAVSADGRYVAYLFRDGEDTSLRLRQVGAVGETHVLVHEALLFPGLAFSPDGNYLYFLRATLKDSLYRDLYEIPALGGPQRKVTPNVDSAISFSPEGQQFVYESGMPRRDSVEIRIANADGSADRLLVNLQGAWAGFTPGAAWSPDGSSVVVPVWMHHKHPGFLLSVVSTANGEVRELYSGSEAIGRPRWLPEGNMLVVPMNDRNGRTQLWTMSYPAGKTRRLTNDLGDYDLGINMTRDGKTLSTIQWTTISNLWVFQSLKISNGKQITSGEQQIFEAFPLNDGKLATVNRSDSGLWSINPDGSRNSLITDTRGASWFSGCGRFILYESERTGSSDLMRIDEDGANAKRLATGTMWGQTCSPDGRFVYFAEALQPRWKIRRVSIEGGSATDVVENPGESIPGRVAISPDGQLLAFPYDVSTPEPALKIAVVRIGGGPLVRTFDVPEEINGPRWSPDGRGL